MVNTGKFHDAADFTEQALSHLPRGAIWRRDGAGVQADVFRALGDVEGRAHRRIFDLSEIESDPAITNEMLPDWERAWGLPDPCTPLAASIDARRRALLSKLVSVGGQSPAYFVSVAAALGYEITITEFRPLEIGDDVDGSVMGPAWADTWQVNAAGVTIEVATCEGDCDDFLRWWGNSELECRLNQLKPAHTVLLFRYGY